MNPCNIYWNDNDRTNNIDIRNEEEINFVRDCITKFYEQLLNLLKNNIRPGLHEQLENEYYNIINNYREKNIIYQINIMITTEKYKLPTLVINEKILKILEIMRQKADDCCLK